MWDVFKIIWAMEFVFSQSRQNKIGTWIQVWFFGNYGKGVSVGSSFSLSWASVSECLKHFLPTPIPHIFLLWPSLELDSFSPVFCKRRVFFLPCGCWVCPRDHLLWPPSGQNLYFHYLTLKLSTWLSWANGVVADGCDGSRGLKRAFVVRLALLCLCHHHEQSFLQAAAIPPTWTPKWAMGRRPGLNWQWGAKSNQTHSLKQSQAEPGMNQPTPNQSADEWMK